MIQRRNPNLTALDITALRVPCPYCKAPVNSPCWALRNHHGQPREFTHVPHKSRIKLSWRKLPNT